jgi:hypothetical protein
MAFEAPFDDLILPNGRSIGLEPVRTETLARGWDRQADAREAAPTRQAASR